MNPQPLLDFIAEHESEGAARRLKISAYDVVWGGIAAKHRPAKLSAMTIAEVLAWQDSIDALYRSEAAGRYQIMEDTLRSLYREAGLTGADLFDKAGQDRLAVALLKRRGLEMYLDGRITLETFCNNLAREWASLPMVSGPKRGRSYYDGDGLNKAGVDVAPFIAAVRAVSLSPKPVAVSPAPVSVVKPAPAGEYPGFWAAIIAIIASFFGGKK